MRKPYLHTPGPWVAEEGDTGRWTVKSLHWTDEEPGICGDHSKAWRLLGDDARLIAAAPELLTGLVHAARRNHEPSSGCTACVMAEEAIAKAEGK